MQTVTLTFDLVTWFLFATNRLVMMIICAKLFFNPIMYGKDMARTRFWNTQSHKHTHTHTHTDRVNSICPSAILWRGHKKYKRGINLTDGIDTTLISTSDIMAGIGLAVPVMLPLEIDAIVCGCMGACVKLVRRTLMYYEIKTIGESKLNSVNILIFKALADGQIC